MVTERQEARGCLLIGLGCCGALFLFGIAMLNHGIISPQRAVSASKNWTETQCEIVHSAIIEQDDDESSSSSYVPEPIASFYREVGPVNISIEGYGEPAVIPSLSELWDLHTSYRADVANKPFWMRTVGRLFDRWDSDWIVVAKEGRSSVFIFSIRTGRILSAYGMRDGDWEPREVHPDINTMAACMAILGSVCAEAGEDFSTDSGIRQQYLDQAVSLLTEELGNETEARSIIGPAGWA